MQRGAATVATAVGAAVPKPSAATLVIAPKVGQAGLQVCMIKRPSTMSFMPDVYVFPGGGVDSTDEKLSVNTTNDVDSHGGKYRVCAIRELAEEVGIVFDAGGSFSSTRVQSTTYGGARLLVPYQHWITPKTAKRRFETYFFLLQVPSEYVANVPLQPQVGEVEDARWIDPTEALQLHAEKDSGFKMAPPTFLMMHHLSTIQAAPDLVDEHRSKWGDRMSMLPTSEPIIDRDDAGVPQMHLPSGTIHLPNGVHEFMGGGLFAAGSHDNKRPKQEVPETWRVIVGSPLFETPQRSKGR